LIPHAAKHKHQQREAIPVKARLFKYLRAPLTWHGSWYQVPEAKARLAIGEGHSRSNEERTIVINRPFGF
jgi:hypothetical protein